MPPPRTQRMQSAGYAPPHVEPSPDEVLDAMRAYASAQGIHEMLHVLLTKLLAAQPLDPFAFLIDLLRDDPELDALELRAKVQRYDLRRERTKRRLLVAFYRRLVLLQRTQHHPNEPAPPATSEQLAMPFLLQQLRLEETRRHLREQFPSHYRDLIHAFLSSEKELKPMISIETFTARGLEILAAIATV